MTTNYKKGFFDMKNANKSQAERIKELDRRIIQLEALHQAVSLQLGVRDQELTALRAAIAKEQ